MIPIIFSTDHNYIVPTGVAITSLLTNSTDETYEINILISDNVTDEDKNQLKEVVASSSSGIKFKNSGNIFDNAYETRGITKATYFRLLIPWIFPEYNKVIYCDGDVIFRRGLNDLYNEDIENFYVGGVLDFYDDKLFIKYLNEIGLNWDYYINAGVLLINSNLWRINKLDEAIKKHLYTKYEYQDQDIINILCRDKIKYLSPVYNFNSNKYCTFMSGKESPTDRYNVNMEELIKNIHIIHYCGLKPWNTMSQFLSGDWYAYYALSVFYSPGKEYKKYYDIIFPSWYDVIKLFYRRIKKAIQK